MTQRDLYLCLMLFKDDFDRQHKFMTAPIASSETEAKEMSSDAALTEHPEYANYRLVECSAYSFRRSALEDVAREVLGWEAPEDPRT